MKQRHVAIAILAVFAAASWLVFRVPQGAQEQKGILKERIRAAESAMHTLDAARAKGRERLRLANETADDQHAAHRRAAAALPFYEQRRREAEAALATLRQQQRNDDGSKNPPAGDAALLDRLNALLR